MSSASLLHFYLILLHWHQRHHQCGGGGSRVGGPCSGRIQPPLSLPQVNSSSDPRPLLPSSANPRPPLPPSSVLDPRLPLALAVVGAAAAAVGVAVTVVTTATVAVAPAAPLHRLLAKVGAAPPDRPSTTHGPTPSACGQSHPDRRTPSSLHRRWDHCSCLLWRLCLFLELRHLSRSPGRRG
jgi:hypothetical protein